MSKHRKTLCMCHYNNKKKSCNAVPSSKIVTITQTKHINVMCFVCGLSLWTVLSCSEIDILNVNLKQKLYLLNTNER